MPACVHHARFDPRLQSRNAPKSTARIIAEYNVWVKGESVRERDGYSYQPTRWVEDDGRWNLERSH